MLKNWAKSADPTSDALNAQTRAGARSGTEAAQVAKAADAASKAATYADEDDKPSAALHAKARQLHEQAAKLFDKAGDRGKASRHHEAAREHAELA